MQSARFAASLSVAIACCRTGRQRQSRHAVPRRIEDDRLRVRAVLVSQRSQGQHVLGSRLRPSQNATNLLVRGDLHASY